MIKLGFNLFVVLRCSMLISGSSQLKKGMLSIAVFVELCYDQATALVGFSGQTGTSLLLMSGHNQDREQTDQNCIVIFWLYVQHWHSFCCICYTFAFTTKIFMVLLTVKNTLNVNMNLSELISLGYSGIISILLFEKSHCSWWWKSKLCHQEESVLITVQCKL